MKRELAQILDAKSLLGETLGRTRSSRASSSAGVSGSSSSKRFRGCVVDGLIVYTRGRMPRSIPAGDEKVEKSSRNPSVTEEVRDGECESAEVLVVEESNSEMEFQFKVEAIDETAGSSSVELRRFTRSALKLKAEDAERDVEESDERAVEDKLVPNLDGESNNVGLGSPTTLENNPMLKKIAVEVEKSSRNPNVVEEVRDGKCELFEVLVVEESNSEMEFSLKVEPIDERSYIRIESGSAPVALRRYTRSALKPKAEEVERGMEESEERVVEDELVSNLEGESNNVGLGSPTTPKNKLELKMSKKIALHKRPTTVKELFDTGIVEGIPVVYMGGKKACGLKGTIKDGGILCSCSCCKGIRVIPPSQFEIHACKQYRRAAQYICLENGKSLLDLLKACRNVSLHTMESAVQSFISSPPDDTYFTCKTCKVSYPPSCVAKDETLCNSCLELKNPQISTDDTLGLSSPTPLPISVHQSPKSAPVYNLSSSNKGDTTLTRKSSTPLPMAKAYKSASLKLASTPQKRGRKPGTKSKKPLSITKSSKSASASQKKALSLTKSPKSASTTMSPQKKAQWKITTKDIRLHKMVFEDGGLPDGSEVAYYARGKKLLEGYKKGAGIFCRCCNCEISPSQFEAHAGWASRRKPYAYIYTSNGVSLHEFAVSLSKGRKYSAKDNDDWCIICADGGNLLLCDGCPRAFHKECASLSTVPRGDWYCQYCQSMFQREKYQEYSQNALAAGRITGIDPIEEITSRCIRIVKNIEAELSGCVLCRGHDFSKSGFGPRTIILCDQCEKEYHVGCLKKNKMANLKELPPGKWFCCTDCSNINSTLQKLLVTESEKLPDSLLDDVRKKHLEKGLDISLGFDVSWRLINGKIASPDSRILLSKVIAIFHECFDPIVDFQSGRDLIPAMVYGRNVRGQDFGGMYCAILTVNSTVVSAGMIRVLGQEIAELPLVATSNCDHGKGYFQLLFSCIEKLLAFMNVKSLVLPAAEEAESIWTNKFGFSKINPEQLVSYRKTCYQMVTFQGTSMLEKRVPKCRITPAPINTEAN